MIPSISIRGQINDGISRMTAEFHEAAIMLDLFRAQLINPRAIQFASHGVGRRILILRINLIHLLRMCERPADRPLHGDLGTELGAHLNSFYIHLHGLLDNLAWMIAHELNFFNGVSENKAPDRNKVGLFRPEFQKQLNVPSAARFISSKKDWYDATKDWRDPIAHRIPLYAIPCVYTNDDAAEFERLSDLAMEALQAGDAEQSDHYHSAKMRLGTYHPIFAHETGGHPTPIKEQVEADARNLLDIIWFFIESDWKAGR
jgi:hypothetical protein